MAEALFLPDFSYLSQMDQVPYYLINPQALLVNSETDCYDCLLEKKESYLPDKLLEESALFFLADLLAIQSYPKAIPTSSAIFVNVTVSPG